MELQQLDPALVDDSTVEAVVRLHNNALCHDAPHQPPLTKNGYLRKLRYGWDGDPPQALWTAYQDGALAGYAELWLPKWDNRHVAGVEAITAPEHRGHGIGAALLETLLAAARQEGRTLALSDCWAGTAGEAFLTARGFTVGSTEEERRLDLRELDGRRIDALYDQAAAHAGEYELVSVVGAAPSSMIDGLVELFSAINDAPLEDLQVDDEVFSAERVRAFDQAQSALGRRMYRLLARHTATGAWAGHTILMVDEDQPEWALQADTSVVQAHRGNRLGMLLKTAMLRWLRTVEPQVERIDTWNTASNRHMIAVNDELGCVVVGRASACQRRLDA
jgi:GNAT superfamily N-acetyltransferase